MVPLIDGENLDGVGQSLIEAGQLLGLPVQHRLEPPILRLRLSNPRGVQRPVNLKQQRTLGDDPARRKIRTHVRERSTHLRNDLHLMLRPDSTMCHHRRGQRSAERWPRPPRHARAQDCFVAVAPAWYAPAATWRSTRQPIDQRRSLCGFPTSLDPTPYSLAISSRGQSRCLI